MADRAPDTEEDEDAPIPCQGCWLFCVRDDDACSHGVRRLVSVRGLIPCLLTLLLAASCTPQVAPLTGTLTAIQPDSVRWVTPERNQPYALEWPRNNVMNLWLFVTQTRACRVGILDQYARREYAATLRGTRSGSSWDGVVTSATDSSVSGTFTLQVVTPDSMAGLAVMTSTDDCGACRDTISLTLARLP